MISVMVSPQDFDVRELTARLSAGQCEAGAVATFIGLVREGAEENKLEAMILEHYPAMTEKALQQIAERAGERWPLMAVEIYHRVGQLLPGDKIVFVGVASRHRHAAFEACAFIMDFLKTEAPFWKKEMKGGKGAWVDARDSDHAARERWLV